MGLPSCDQCEPQPELPSNQDAVSLEGCPPLPEGVEPIEGLVTGQIFDRFDGMVLTLSDRGLACGEPAAQSGRCGPGRGLTVGFVEEPTPGVWSFGGTSYIELETPNSITVGAGLRNASLEFFTVTDTCATGRLVGVEDDGGPFDGGFRAPRCTP